MDTKTKILVSYLGPGLLLMIIENWTVGKMKKSTNAIHII